MQPDIDQYKQTFMQLNPRIRPEEWAYFEEELTVEHYKPRDHYIEAGQPNHRLGFVTHGLVRGYYINDAGEDITTLFVPEFDWVTDYPSLLLDRPSRYNDGMRYGQASPLYPEVRNEPPKIYKTPVRQVREYSPAPVQPFSEQITHRDVIVRDKSRIVTTIEEQYAYSGSILRPDEAQTERLAVATVNTYPAEWDEPAPLDAVPVLKPLTFHQWQQRHPSFKQLGLGSLPVTIQL